MAGEVSGSAAYPPEVQEKLSRLEKLEKEHSALGYKLRAWERIDKELGDVLERDAYGNPVRILTDEPTPPPTSFQGSHPLSGLGLDKPEAVDAYYDQLFRQKGYLTKQEAEAMADAKAQTYANLVMGNAKVWRNYDKLTQQETYKALSDANSDLSKRTAKILQERQYGRPMTEQAKGFDEWQYRDIGDLRFAADLARLEMDGEAKASASSAAAAQAAQGAASFSPSPTAGAGAGAPAAGGRPDFASMQTPDEIIAALDQANASPP
jgi:hypothetical protein